MHAQLQRVNEVYITNLAKFFPNNPVSNDEMEDYLGLIDGKKSKARAIILRNNGITNRFYAIDKEGKLTHSNAELAANAVKLLAENGFDLKNMDLLACGTTSPDQIVPSHASMVHGALGVKPVETVSPSGACNTSILALNYAFMSVKAGIKQNAVVVGSERLASWMLARHFEPETENLHRLNEDGIIAFEKDFLRWMLSDGAGAALLQPKPAENGLSIRIDWLEFLSYANEMPTCMYAGAEKNDQGEIVGYASIDAHDWGNKSVFSLKQDVKLLGANIVELGGRFLKDVAAKHQLNINEIDYFLPHMSSNYFKPKIYKVLDDIGLHIPYEKWFTNLTEVGNIGAAAIFVMLHEMMEKNMLKKGQRILIMIPESARFNYAYGHLTVV